MGGPKLSSFGPKRMMSPTGAPNGLLWPKKIYVTNGSPNWSQKRNVTNVQNLDPICTFKNTKNHLISGKAFTAGNYFTWSSSCQILDTSQCLSVSHSLLLLMWPWCCCYAVPMLLLVAKLFWVRGRTRFVKVLTWNCQSCYILLALCHSMPWVCCDFGDIFHSVLTIKAPWGVVNGPRGEPVSRFGLPQISQCPSYSQSSQTLALWWRPAVKKTKRGKIIIYQLWTVIS